MKLLNTNLTVAQYQKNAHGHMHRHNLLDWTKAVISRLLHCAYESIAGALLLAYNEKKKILMDTMQRNNAYSKIAWGCSAQHQPVL